MRYTQYRAVILALCVVGLLLPVITTHAAQTSAERRCFPETGYCISGRFRQFWEQNGGLPVFGYPIGEVYEGAGSGATAMDRPPAVYLVQLFERARLELHPENAAPYQVLLGRLGDERLRANGIDWLALPREAGPKPGCLWFEQTGHNVCDQTAGRGFKTTWLNSWLRELSTEVGTRDPIIRSLAFMGLPLTSATMEIHPTDGRTYLTQTFERARLEWHPDEPEPYRVLFGLLGRELGASAAAAQLPSQAVTYRWPARLPRGLTVLPPDYAIVSERGAILALGNRAGVTAYLSMGAYAGGSSYVTSDGSPALSMAITVRGQAGLSYTIPHGNLIVWQEDGTTYAISSPYSISVDQLVALADRLEAVDQATLRQRVGLN